MKGETGGSRDGRTVKNGQQTLLFPQMSRAPIGANKIPMMKRVGRTVFGVRIGCHAFRRCCLKAVSADQ
jgi:hypothetical protein